MGDDRWTAAEYLLWVSFLVGITILLGVTYMGAMAIGRWAL